MRLGVLDVGSNTVHLLVVDAHPGARPLPAYSHKADLRLAELLDEGGAISADGVDRLVATIADALRVAEDKGAEDVLPLFARDKKAIQGVTFVLDGPNGVEQVKGIDERHLRDALEALRP